MTDKRHNVAVILTRRTKHADVAVIAERTTETTDNKAHVGTAANGVLGTDVDAERLVWSCLSQPRLEVVEQICNLLYLVPTDKLWLTKKVT